MVRPDFLREAVQRSSTVADQGAMNTVLLTTLMLALAPSTLVASVPLASAAGPSQRAGSLSVKGIHCVSGRDAGEASELSGPFGPSDLIDHEPRHGLDLPIAHEPDTLKIRGASFDFIRDDEVATLAVYATDAAGRLSAVEHIEWEVATGDTTIEAAYLIPAGWIALSVTLDGRGNRKWGDSSMAVPQFVRLHEEFVRKVRLAQPAAFAPEGEDVQAGPGRCFLSLAAATGACGVLAGVPGAGWLGCSLGVMSALCTCFDELACRQG